MTSMDTLPESFELEAIVGRWRECFFHNLAVQWVSVTTVPDRVDGLVLEVSPTTTVGLRFEFEFKSQNSHLTHNF